MPVIKLADGEGKTISVLDVDGDYLPPDFNTDVVKGLMTLPIRSDDVIICSYPKTGCHWVWEITCMLLKGTTQVDQVEKERYMIEWHERETLDAHPSPRVLNTHMLIRRLNPDLLKKRCKIVFLLRNAKDTAVSFYNHHTKLPEYEFSGSWACYLDLFLNGKVDYGCFFDYIKDWEKFIEQHPDYPLIVMKYEDLKEDPVREINRLSQFLDRNHNHSFIQEVADASNFQRMRERKGQMWLTEKGEPIFYRKGQVGDWQNWFTVAQNKRFDMVSQENMAGCSFHFRETLN